MPTTVERNVRPSHASRAPAPFAEVLRIAQSASYCGMGYTAFWEARRTDPNFPSPIKLTERARGFRRADLDRWLETRRTA